MISPRYLKSLFVSARESQSVSRAEERMPIVKPCGICGDLISVLNPNGLCPGCFYKEKGARKDQEHAVMRQQLLTLHGALSGQQAPMNPLGGLQGQNLQAQLQWQQLQAAQAMVGLSYGLGFPYNSTSGKRAAIAQTEPETVIGPILAYRSWRVRKTDLFSLNAGNQAPVMDDLVNTPRWIPGEPMTGDVTEHGIYAHRHPAYIERDPSYVSGGVWLWGDVIEHENGFRAEFGYPAFLWVVDKKIDWADPKTFSNKNLRGMKRLAERYEIPLFAVESLEGLPEREGLRERLLLGDER